MSGKVVLAFWYLRPDWLAVELKGVMRLGNDGSATTCTLDDGVVNMRMASADYNEIERALLPHQLRTLEEYAHSRGYCSTQWSQIPVCATMAIALALQNALPDARARGATERAALLRLAARFDLDPETILRGRRKMRRLPAPDD